MMDEFIHCPKTYLLLSRTFDELLSWMNEIWMEIHSASDNNCNVVNLKIPNIFLQGMTNNVGLTFNVGDTILRFTISIEPKQLELV